MRSHRHSAYDFTGRPQRCASGQHRSRKRPSGPLSDAGSTTTCIDEEPPRTRALAAGRLGRPFAARRRPHPPVRGGRHYQGRIRGRWPTGSAHPPHQGPRAQLCASRRLQRAPSHPGGYPHHRGTADGTPRTGSHSSISPTTPTPRNDSGTGDPSGRGSSTAPRHDDDATQQRPAPRRSSRGVGGRSATAPHWVQTNKDGPSNAVPRAPSTQHSRPITRHASKLGDDTGPVDAPLSKLLSTRCGGWCGVLQEKCDTVPALILNA